MLDIVSNIRLEGEFGLGAPVEEVCEVLLEGKQCMVGAGGGVGAGDRGRVPRDPAPMGSGPRMAWGGDLAPENKPTLIPVVVGLLVRAGALPGWCLCPSPEAQPGPEQARGKHLRNE